jgi:CRISPR-associated exonuclease Cas4
MKSSDNEQKYDDDDLLQLSGLQHLAYCERQWGLIHIEDQWKENVFTAEGRILHKRTEVTETEVRGNIRITHGLRLRSLRLGLVGRADVVEFHRIDKTDAPDENIYGVELKGAKGLWIPFPVEHKRGKPKSDHCDEVQLCAQALCLEEMLGVQITQGSLFYGRPRRRSDVQFDETLRTETEKLAQRMHELARAGITPPPTDEYSRCKGCSLRDVCLPKTAYKQNAGRYLEKQLEKP